jgi:hypothetical protein
MLGIRSGRLFAGALWYAVLEMGLIVVFDWEAEGEWGVVAGDY